MKRSFAKTGVEQKRDRFFGIKYQKTHHEARSDLFAVPAKKTAGRPAQADAMLRLAIHW